MKRTKHARIFGVMLLLLVCVLGMLTAARIRLTRDAPDAVFPEEESNSNILSGDAVPEGLPDADAVPDFSTVQPSISVVEPTQEAAALPSSVPSPEPRPLREIAICEDNLDESLFLPAAEKGSVELVQYLTEDYVSGGDVQVMKDLAIYLPYGYDAQKQYNVLILLHCAWADHLFWLVQDRDYRIDEEGNSAEDSSVSSIAVSVPNMLDRMIEEGWCKPLIVVSPCIYLYDRHPSAAGNQYDYTQFSREYGLDLLSFLAENYATYAADGSRKALADAREHFGVLGASFGAYAEYISIIGDNYDLTAWYSFCGGGAIDPGYLVSSWEAAGTQDLPLRLLYISEGEFDDRYAPESSYHDLLHYGETIGGSFTEENTRYTMIRGWGHEDHSYLVGLFNTLQLFFRI